MSTERIAGARKIREEAARSPVLRGGGSGRARHPAPVLAWFNPDAEGETLAAMAGRARNPNARVRAMEEDLEILALAWCGPDDLAVLRNPPSAGHLQRLRHAGWKLPGIVGSREIGELKRRRLEGFRPWAWSPEAAEMLRPLAANASSASPYPWREALPAEWFSKKLGLDLEDRLGTACGVFCAGGESALAALDHALARGPALLKAPIACAGRGHRRIAGDIPAPDDLAWIDATLASHGGVVVEPWLERIADFSAQYESQPGGTVRLLGITVMDNDSAGRFRAIRYSRKWDSLLAPDVARLLIEECDARALFSQRIPPLLAKLLPGYVGPVGIDAMVHRRPDGSSALRPVVEVNARMTMGRVAIELAQRLGSPDHGQLRIVGKSDWDKHSLPLNDPAAARQFIATWESPAARK